jgi:glutamate N-acetyltransferase/amino-acid N-acetyltransferase
LKTPPWVPGFLAGGTASGIKKRGARDMALIFCPQGATAAGVFTTNQVKSPAVLISRARLARGRAHAVLANSGCANTYTGQAGTRDTREITRQASAALGVREGAVLMSSTGVIGSRLPLGKMSAALPGLVACLSATGWQEAAEAIMTTDTRPKLALRKARLAEGDVRVLGIAKGAGMIEPHMATLLVFLATNAAVPAPFLRRVLREACDGSFNRVTIDGCMSTSDTAVILASGTQCRGPLAPAGPSGKRFARMVAEVCRELAEAIVSDGEGVTKRVVIHLRGARTDRQARLAAYAVGNSPLVKTALRGEDPNWGRIVQALGASPARIRPDRIGIRFGKAVLLRCGRWLGPAAEEAARRVMRADAYEIGIDLGAGRGKAEVLTCDLTEDYIRINADYRS